MDLSKDIAALESLNDKHLREYYSTPSLQGKKWYGLGLEDNESSNQKDDSNKKGVIRKMIDALIEFMSRMIKKVKEFFTGKKKDGVETEKVFKEYDGPGDDATAQAFSDFVRTSEASEKHAAEMSRKMKEDEKKHQEYMAKSQKDHDEFMERMDKSNKEFDELSKKLATDKEAAEKLARDINALFKKTGEKPTLDSIEKDVISMMVERFFQGQHYQTTTWFVMTLRDDYVKQYKIAYEAFEEVTTTLDKGSPPNAEDTKVLQEAVDACFKMQEKHRLTEKKDMVEIMTKVVKGDHDLNNYSAMYLRNSDSRIREMDTFHNKAKAKLVSIQDTASAEEVAEYRKLIMALGQYWVLFTRISDWSHHVARILKNGK